MTDERETVVDFKDTLQKHLDAIRDRDLEAYAATVDDAAVLVLGNGTVLQGKEAIVRMHQEWFEDTDWTLTTQLESEAVAGDTASVVLRVAYSDVDPQGRPIEASYLLGLVFARREGWLMIHDQNTNP